jgi:hypothetical protein
VYGRCVPWLFDVFAAENNTKVSDDMLDVYRTKTLYITTTYITPQMTNTSALKGGEASLGPHVQVIFIGQDTKLCFQDRSSEAYDFINEVGQRTDRRW